MTSCASAGAHRRGHRRGLGGRRGGRSSGATAPGLATSSASPARSAGRRPAWRSSTAARAGPRRCSTPTCAPSRGSTPGARWRRRARPRSSTSPTAWPPTPAHVGRRSGALLRVDLDRLPLADGVADVAAQLGVAGRGAGRDRRRGLRAVRLRAPRAGGRGGGGGRADLGGRGRRRQAGRRAQPRGERRCAWPGTSTRSGVADVGRPAGLQRVAVGVAQAAPRRPRAGRRRTSRCRSGS